MAKRKPDGAFGGFHEPLHHNDSLQAELRQWEQASDEDFARMESEEHLTARIAELEELRTTRRRDAAIEKHLRTLRTALGAARIFVSRNQDKSDAAYVDGELDRGDAALSALAAGLEGGGK